ncbi:hypothetical protein DITRI_Ditri18aG0037400 [Diplodiscus trichospermus]
MKPFRRLSTQYQKSAQRTDIIQSIFYDISIYAGDPSVSCSTCGTPCVLRTANTANNRGRKFYSCSSHECNFFIWEDGLNNGTGGRSNPRAGANSSASNSSRRGGHGQFGHSGARAADVTFVSATGDPVSSRRCYVCGDPSHFANVCPNRGM